MLARLFEDQDLGFEKDNITTPVSRRTICQASPRRLPIVAENCPVHLYSPTLTPLPLVLDKSQVLPGSLSLPFGQTGETVVVQLSHRSRRKLSFQLTESAPLDRLDIAARLLCLLDASLLGRALRC